MQKNKFITTYILLVILLFNSCTEVGPSIELIPSTSGVGNDTTYATTIETPSFKKVLAEEFTGVSCPPCPNGHKLMASLYDQLNGNLVVLSYHINNYPQTAPVEKDGQIISKYDFRTDDATEIGTTFFNGVSAIPVASFDRIAVSGELLLSTTKWSNAAKVRASEKSPVNIHLASSYNSSTREAILKLQFAYTSEILINHNYTIGIIEDSIIDAQKDGLEIKKEYLHKHVLRDIITPIYGTPVPDKVKPFIPGKVYEHSIKYALDSSWKDSHCSFVVFLHYNDKGNKEVIQAEEIAVTK